MPFVNMYKSIALYRIFRILEWFSRFSPIKQLSILSYNLLISGLILKTFRVWATFKKYYVDIIF